MALSITELKKGTIFALEGVPYRVTEYNQKVMGRGGSIVNVKIKSLIDGKVLAKTFKGSEKLDSADVTNRPMQFLYADEQGCHFMDNENYEQFCLPSGDIEQQKSYLRDGDQVSGQLFNGQLIGIELPKNLPLKVTYTEDAVRGDTSTAITKDAKLETGMVIKVPAFIKTGDIISVSTETGAYRERVK